LQIEKTYFTIEAMLEEKKEKRELLNRPGENRGKNVL
jgi:hypothetical protein